MTKVFAYYRVSTNKQFKESTVETQKYSVKNWMKEINVEIIEEFSEIMSGSDSTRPMFNEVLERIDEVDGIVVYDKDRLARDFETGAKMMFLLKEKNKQIWVSSKKEITNFQIDTEQLISMIGFWADERERIKIIGRLKSSIKRRISEGKGWGRKKKNINWNTYCLLMDKLNNNKSAVSRVLRVSYSTLYRKTNEKIEELKKKEILTEEDKMFLEKIKELKKNESKTENKKI